MHTYNYLCVPNTFLWFLQVNSSCWVRSTCDFEKRITLLVEYGENCSQLLIQLRFLKKILTVSLLQRRTLHRNNARAAHAGREAQAEVW
jgi:hypothetical protein